MTSGQKKFASSPAIQSRSCRDSAVVDWPRAIGNPRAWYTALSFLLILPGRSGAAFAAELRARRAIRYLRSLDDDRLWDLGLKRKDIERFVRLGRH